MSNASQIAAVLFNVAGLSALWFFIVQWRGYQTDKLRQDIFKLRAELFDYADTREVSFSNRSYARTRLLLNSMIRFAHQVSFIRVVASVILEKFRPLMRHVPNFIADIDADEELSAGAREFLKSIHGRLANLVVEQVISTSIVASPLLALHAMYRSANCKKQVEPEHKKLEDVLAERRIRYHVQLIEQQAIDNRDEEIRKGFAVVGAR